MGKKVRLDLQYKVEVSQAILFQIYEVTYRV